MKLYVKQQGHDWLGEQTGLGEWVYLIQSAPKWLKNIRNPKEIGLWETVGIGEHAQVSPKNIHLRNMC